MALRSRRQRRVNSKYVSDDFESIFTERRQVSTPCGCKHSAAFCVQINMCKHSTSKCPFKHALLPFVVMDVNRVVKKCGPRMRIQNGGLSMSVQEKSKGLFLPIPAS